MTEDQPITLAEAASDFFRGTLTIASLRAEARRGSLRIYRIGKRDYTTIADLKAMLLCRVVQPVRGINPSNNLSETEQHSVARAAALEAAEMLKSNSRRRTD